MSQVAADLLDTSLVAPSTRAGWGRLAMLLFLASDAITFGSLLVSALVLHADSPQWPTAGEALALALGAAMTVLLLMSSVTMQQALAAMRRSQRQQFRLFLLLTIGAGSAFLGLQAYEWSHLLQAGMTLGSNPWGTPLFGATFYTLTGFHGLHVLAGVLYLLVVLLRGLQQPDLVAYHETVAMAGLYWHFVDVVWVFVFLSLYLLP